MKKILAVVLAAAMVFSLAACGAPAATEEKKEAAAPAAAEEKKEEAAPAAAEEKAEEAAPAAAGDKVPTIAYVPKVMGQAWWDYVQKGVEQWAADNGIDVIYKGPTEVDPAAQVQIMTDLVNQGIDILCFSPNDPNACEAICKEAMDKGIIVICTEASGMQNIDWDVEAFDEAGMGGFLMRNLAEMMGEEGEYITMVGSMTMESHNNWADAAVAYQEANYPNMTLVDDKRVSSESDAEVAYNKVKELKQKYPDLKGILGTSSFDAPGSARAIQELGLTGKMFAISVALPLESADYLEDGTLQTVALWDPAVTAHVQLNAACKMFNGEEITEGMDLGEVGYESVKLNGKVIVGDAALAVTKDNCYDFGF